MSRDHHYLVFYCACAPGNSVAALLYSNDRLIGMQTEGINHMRERVRHAETTEERGSLIEESLDSAIQSVARGAIALLASAFPRIQ